MRSDCFKWSFTLKLCCKLNLQYSKRKIWLICSPCLPFLRQSLGNPLLPCVLWFLGSHEDQVVQVFQGVPEKKNKTNKMISFEINIILYYQCGQFRAMVRAKPSVTNKWWLQSKSWEKEGRLGSNFSQEVSFETIIGSIL